VSSKRPITPEPPPFSPKSIKSQCGRTPVPHPTTPTTPPSTPLISSTKSQLGKYVQAHTSLLRQVGWAAFIKQLQFPSDCSSPLHTLPHPAGSYLHRLATNGVPAPSSSPPWSKAMLHTALRRGAHASAKFHFRDFLKRSPLGHGIQRLLDLAPVLRL